MKKEDRRIHDALRYLEAPHESDYRDAWAQICQLVDTDPLGSVPTVLRMIALSPTPLAVSYVTSEFLIHLVFAGSEGSIVEIVGAAQSDDKVCAALNAIVRYEKKLSDLERILAAPSPSERRREYVGALYSLEKGSDGCAAPILDVRIVSTAGLTSVSVTFEENAQADEALATRCRNRDELAFEELEDLLQDDPAAAWATLCFIIDEPVNLAVMQRVARLAWFLFSRFETELLAAVIRRLPSNPRFKDMLSLLTFDGLSEAFIDGVLTTVRELAGSSADLARA